MITFDENGLHFDVDLNEEDFKALERYVTAVRIDERINLIKFLDSTLPKAQPAEEAAEPVAEVADEPTE